MRIVLIVTLLIASAAVDALRLKRQTLLSQAALDASLKNKNLVNKQVNCLLDRGPCDDRGLELKRVAPNVFLEGHCPRCSPQQENQVRHVMRTLARDYRPQFQALLKKYRDDSIRGVGPRPVGPGPRPVRPRPRPARPQARPARPRVQA